MNCQLLSGDITQLSTPCLIIPIFSEPHELSITARTIDTASNQLISKLRTSGDFKAKAEETLILHHPENMKAERLLLIGCGDAKKFDGLSFQNCILAATKALASTAATTATFCISDLSVKNRDALWNLRHAALNAVQQTYQFNQFKSTQDKEPPKSIEAFNFYVAQLSTAEERAIQEGQAIAEGMAFARDLGNCPPNVCHPIYLANTAQKLAAEFPSLSYEALDEAALKKLGAGAFLAVSQGSEQEGRLIIVKYQGADAEQRPYALVGKGITFDTGGISLKPGAEMDEMKFDMCGAASVLGTLRAVAQLKLPINVIVIVAAAENMPSGHATRPGDIIATLSGKTVEILNTDAEGRLVLCDALTYAQQKFNPIQLVDVATLTGACVVALGNHTAGLLSNNDALSQALLAAGEQANDRAWQLPLWEVYKKQLDSPFADMANIGGKGAGTITAACFLAEFTQDTAWAHLDIAGVAWKSGKEKGATGRPVPLLTQYLIQQAAST